MNSKECRELITELTKDLLPEVRFDYLVNVLCFERHFKNHSDGLGKTLEIELSSKKDFEESLNKGVDTRSST